MRLLRGLLLKPTLNLLSWILRHKDGNSLILGGPLGWTWQATLDATHHGALAGPANAHRHGDLADIGIDDHHARDHATRHQNGGADEMSVAGLSGELADNQPPKAHESTHVAGGSDDIDSALADAAIPNLNASKITAGRFPTSRLPAMTDEKIWKGTGGNVEEIDVPASPADVLQVVASDDLAASADAERSITSTTPTKKKEMTILIGGTYRVKFDIRAPSGSAYGRVYKNGGVWGTERNNTTPYATFSEDLVFATGDLAQLYIWHPFAGTAYCRNFRLYALAQPQCTIDLN